MRHTRRLCEEIAQIWIDLIERQTGTFTDSDAAFVESKLPRPNRDRLRDSLGRKTPQDAARVEALEQDHEHVIISVRRDLAVRAEDAKLAAGAATRTHGSEAATGADSPLVFISHSHRDTELASLLLIYLRKRVDIPDALLRCTSVPGYKLRPGRSIAREIKESISKDTILIGLLTPTSRQSDWVMFELGAGWLTDCLLIPVLAHGLAIQELPDPLRDRVAVDLSDEGASQSIEDATRGIAERMHLTLRSQADGQAALADLLRVGREPRAPVGDAPGGEGPMVQLGERAQQLLSSAANSTGYILLARHMSGMQVRAGRTAIWSGSDAREIAEWEGARDDLLARAYVDVGGESGEVFRVTRSGYAYVKQYAGGHEQGKNAY